MKSRQVSARSKAGRRADRSWAAVGQAGQTTTAAPSSQAAANRRRRARSPSPSWEGGGGAGARSRPSGGPWGVGDEAIIWGKSYTLDRASGSDRIMTQSIMVSASRGQHGLISIP